MAPGILEELTRPSAARYRTGLLRDIAFAVLAALSLTACASTPKAISPLSAAQTPRFDALAFFTGKSEGRGELSKVFSDTVPVRVSSEGTLQPDGSLTLVQRIREGDKPERTRTWQIREIAPGGYQGTLTDANGPVTGTATGNRLTLRYPMEGGFTVKQVLTLSADGASAYNRLKVSYGPVTVAVLAEEIVRAD